MANSPPAGFARQRRSQRVLLSVAIQVSGKRANGSAFLESTHTVVVNAHGALIQLREIVAIGQELRLKHLATKEQLNCRVVDINPRQNGVGEVGVQFSEPCPHFWKVSFPPADWNPRNPEARHYGSNAEPAERPLVKK